MGGPSWLLAVAWISTVKATANPGQGDPSQTVPWKNGIGVSCAGTAAPGKTPVPAGAGEIWGMGYGMPSPDPPGSLSPEPGGTAG